MQALAPTYPERLWTILVAFLLSLKPLFPPARNLALPIRLSNRRRMWVGDISELRVIREVRIEDTYPAAVLPASAAVIVDLGANAGATCEFFAERYPSATIAAYEADPAVAARARRNAKGLRVEVHAVAVSDSTAMVELRRSVGTSWATSVHAEEGESFSAPGVTLDSIIAERGQVDILKIDIEGAEYGVLKACRELSQVKLIVGEFHPVADVTGADFFGLLTDFDVLEGGGPDRGPFIARRRS